MMITGIKRDKAPEQCSIMVINISATPTIEMPIPVRIRVRMGYRVASFALANDPKIRPIDGNR